MVNYQNGKIYKIVNKVNDKIFIGSTTQLLCKRKASHKSRAYGSETLLYKELNAIGWDTVDLILIESYPCNSLEELEARERYYYDLLKPELNSVRPCVSEVEKIQKQIEWREEKKQSDPDFYKKMNEKAKKISVWCDCGDFIQESSLKTHLKTKRHLRNMEDL